MKIYNKITNNLILNLIDEWKKLVFAKIQIHPYYELNEWESKLELIENKLIKLGYEYEHNPFRIYNNNNECLLLDEAYSKGKTTRYNTLKGIYEDNNERFIEKNKYYEIENCENIIIKYFQNENN